MDCAQNDVSVMKKTRSDVISLALPYKQGPHGQLPFIVFVYKEVLVNADTAEIL